MDIGPVLYPEGGVGGDARDVVEIGVRVAAKGRSGFKYIAGDGDGRIARNLEGFNGGVWGCGHRGRDRNY